MGNLVTMHKMINVNVSSGIGSDPMKISIQVLWGELARAAVCFVAAVNAVSVFDMFCV